MIREKITGVAAVAVLALMGTSCSLFHEDLQPCAVKPDSYAETRFIADYNTESKDKFANEIGGITLYLYDETGKLFKIEERNNTAHANALTDSEFNISFAANELEPGHKYTAYAVGYGHDAGHQGLLQDYTINFDKKTYQTGIHTADDFAMTLGRDANGVVTKENDRIGDVWVSRRPVEIVIPEIPEPKEGDLQQEDIIVRVTIPMMQVTNRIHVIFWHPDNLKKIDPTQFDIKLESEQGTGKLSNIGAPLETGKLIYYPHTVKKFEKTINGMTAECVEADFDVSRLMTQGSMHLIITDKVTGNTCDVANLTNLLLKGKEKYSTQNWGDQEYLDRQNLFEISYPLGYPMPEWVDVSISALSWTKRIQTVDF